MALPLRLPVLLKLNEITLPALSLPEVNVAEITAAVQQSVHWRNNGSH